MVDRRILKDAVAEIEDVSTLGECVKDSRHGVLQRGTAGNQRQRIEIALEREADAILTAFGGRPFIFNLGHGILPDTPIAHVERLLKRVRG
jgi:hypothetical protein